jgi:hypothetical protein
LQGVSVFYKRHGSVLSGTALHPRVGFLLETADGLEVGFEDSKPTWESMIFGP